MDRLHGSRVDWALPDDDLTDTPLIEDQSLLHSLASEQKITPRSQSGLEGREEKQTRKGSSSRLCSGTLNWRVAGHKQKLAMRDPAIGADQDDPPHAQAMHVHVDGTARFEAEGPYSPGSISGPSAAPERPEGATSDIAKDHDARLDGSTQLEKIVSANGQPFPSLSRVQTIVIPTVCMMATVLQAASTVGATLPIAPISRDFDLPSFEIQWISSTMALGFACTLLLFGRLADIWGHKFFFLTGLVLMGLFQLACGLSQNKYEFFLFRALCGCACAW